MSLPVRGAWIEMHTWHRLVQQKSSLPVRGAWIEILKSVHVCAFGLVAPRAGSVD